MIEKKQLCFVIGSHRSGTSAMAASGEYFGFSLGENLLESAPDNEAGFFEDREFLAINEEMLASLNRTWDTVLPISQQACERLYKSDVRIRAIDFLLNKLDGKPSLMLKDPRATLFIPFWQQVADSINLATSYVLMLRSPIAVARSLKKRNMFSLTKGGLIWFNYTLAAYSSTEQQRRLVVDYDDYVENSTQVFARLTNFHNNLSSSTAPNGMADDLTGVVNAGYRHHSAPVDSTIDPVLRHLMSFYGSLRLLNQAEKAGRCARFIESFSKLTFARVQAKEIFAQLQPVIEDETQAALAVSLEHRKVIDTLVAAQANSQQVIDNLESSNRQNMTVIETLRADLRAVESGAEDRALIGQENQIEELLLIIRNLEASNNQKAAAIANLEAACSDRKVTCSVGRCLEKSMREDLERLTAIIRNLEAASGAKDERISRIQACVSKFLAAIKMNESSSFVEQLKNFESRIKGL